MEGFLTRSYLLDLAIATVFVWLSDYYLPRKIAQVGLTVMALHLLKGQGLHSEYADVEYVLPCRVKTPH